MKNLIMEAKKTIIRIYLLIVNFSLVIFNKNFRVKIFFLIS
jgi:hypothetical protein